MQRRTWQRRTALGMTILVVAAGCGASRSRSDWWAALEAGGLKFPDNRAVLGQSRETFIQVMGEPDRVQALGEYTYWYYRCRDGTIQMVMQTYLLDAGMIATEAINEY